MTEQHKSRGRPPLHADRRRWTIYLPGELARRAEQAAGGAGKRSEWVRDLIEAALRGDRK